MREGACATLARRRSHFAARLAAFLLAPAAESLEIGTYCRGRGRGWGSLAQQGVFSVCRGVVVDGVCVCGAGRCTPRRLR